MRIEFRAWDIDNKRMIYSNNQTDQFIWFLEEDGTFRISEYDGLHEEDLKNIVVMQYTNIDIVDYEPDCDMRIFEGDKIAFTVFDYNDHDKQYEGVVKFAEGQWQIWKTSGSEYYGSDGAFDLCWVVYQDDEIEITGNIHEEV